MLSGWVQVKSDRTPAKVVLGVLPRAEQAQGCWDRISSPRPRRCVRSRGFKIMQTPRLVSFGKELQYNGTRSLPLVDPHH